MSKYEVAVKTMKPVSFLRVNAGVRYWEDATVNGVQDNEESPAIPFANSLLAAWTPVIDLNTGKIDAWPEGVIAKVHYKVCDEGIYTLLDAERAEVVTIDGYVPNMLSPGGSGYGDYIIMDIGPDGQIHNWSVDLDAFDQGAAA